jgi:hypothetical protein
MFRHVPMLCAMAIATVGAAPALADAPPTPTPPTQPLPATKPLIPPGLQALEQKMLALQLTSERISATVSVASPPAVKGPLHTPGPLFGRTSAVAEPLSTITGEISFTPPAGVIQESFLGIEVEARLIGTTLYIHEPFLAHLTHGRTWVEQPQGTLQQETSGLGGAGSSDGAAKLVAAFGAASKVEELGPETADGLQATAFKATVELAHLGTLSHDQGSLLRKLLKPSATLEVLIAEDGLPVRTRIALSFRHGGGELITQSDVLAVNVPVVVTPPPAGETIGEARLKRLLKRRPLVTLHGALAPHGAKRSHKK